jgi:hypothetical protein
MKSEEERQMDKIHYEKPTAVDLGPTAAIVGASCVPGEIVDDNKCYTVGNAASEICDTGNSAGGYCTLVGNLPALA